MCAFTKSLWPQCEDGLEGSGHRGCDEGVFLVHLRNDGHSLGQPALEEGHELRACLHDLGG